MSALVPELTQALVWAAEEPHAVVEVIAQDDGGYRYTVSISGVLDEAEAAAIVHGHREWQRVTAGLAEAVERRADRT